ncbi:MAG TPA: hypothetical protein VIP78_06665 [Candidatus Dormibacteraeota bacterium]|jgi:hypothetical protein
MRRTQRLGLSALAVLVLLLATAGSSSAHVAGVHYLQVKGAHAAHHKGGGSLLVSHGGTIETSAKVFIDYWGPRWGAGFSKR